MWKLWWKKTPFSSFVKQFIDGFFCLQSNRIINGEQQKLFHLPWTLLNKKYCAVPSGFPLYFKITLYQATRDCLIYHGCEFNIEKYVALTWQRNCLLHFFTHNFANMVEKLCGSTPHQWLLDGSLMWIFKNTSFTICVIALLGQETPKYHLTHFGNSLNIFLLTRAQILTFWNSFTHTTTTKVFECCTVTSLNSVMFLIGLSGSNYCIDFFS